MKTVDTDSKIRKVIFNEFTIIVTVLTFFGSLILAYASIKTDIALIKADVNTIRTNEMVHFKASIDAIQARNAEADKRQELMEVQIMRILTLMGKE